MEVRAGASCAGVGGLCKGMVRARGGARSEGSWITRPGGQGVCA